MAIRLFKGLFKGKTKRDKGSIKRDAAVPPLGALLEQIPSRATKSRLPQFQTTASDQLDFRRSDRTAQLRFKVRNTYMPSQPVSDPRMFAGRNDILRQMIRAIEDQRLHLVLYGERGIGKTSLLHALAAAANLARYIVVYWPCGLASNFDETFRAVAAEIPVLFHSGFSPTASEAEGGMTLSELLPNTKISPRIFGELCAKLTGTRVLIILDEFDRSDSTDFRGDVAELIKIASDRSMRINIVVAGVAADLSELVQHIPSIRRNILPMRVPLMSDEEVNDLIAVGESIAGVMFDAEARERVIQSARGSPYIASLLCHHAALIAVDAGRAVVQAVDMAAGTQQALDELRDRIPTPIQGAVESLKKVGDRHLAILAGASLSSGGEFTAATFAEMGAAPAESGVCARIVEELAATGKLMKAREEDGVRRFAFAEDGVPSYLWLLTAHERMNDTRIPARSAG